MAVTKNQIERLGRALFPKYGIKDVNDLVATLVKHGANADGHVTIWRPGGGWSWFRSPAMTTVTPSMVTLAFRSDYRRDAAQAREDLHRQLEKATSSVMTEDEIELATKPPAKPTKSRKPKTASQLTSEIEEATGLKMP